MSTIRDLIYINYDKDLKCLISYGIEFNEFMRSIRNKINNILILQGNFGTHYDITTNCEYCTKDEFDEFIKQDVYSYGDFSWVDFCNYSQLKELSKQEVAELFYISKKWTPVNEIYFPELNNRFIYIAHDDGCTNYTYYNFSEDLEEVIEDVLVDKIKKIYSVEVPNPKEIVKDLIELSVEGIAIDLSRLSFDCECNINIPIFKLGKFKDMDRVYEIVREKDIFVDLEIIYQDKWKISYNT